MANIGIRMTLGTSKFLPGKELREIGRRESCISIMTPTCDKPYYGDPQNGSPNFGKPLTLYFADTIEKTLNPNLGNAILI